MSPSSCLSENDTFMIQLPNQPLDAMMDDDLDALLPIEQEDLLKSFSSMNFDPSIFQSSLSSLLSQPQRRTVTFGGIQSVDYIESAIDMTDQDIADRWFTSSQLHGFKRAARELCRERKAGRDIVEDLDSIRGMEVYFPGRQKSHAKYIFHVLDAFHVQCKGNPEYVAQLCEKWSARSRDRARNTAEQDFYQAHLPHLLVAAGGGDGSNNAGAANHSSHKMNSNKRIHPSAVHHRSNKRSAPSELRAPERTRSL